MIKESYYYYYSVCCELASRLVCRFSGAAVLIIFEITHRVRQKIPIYFEALWRF